MLIRRLLAAVAFLLAGAGSALAQGQAFSNMVLNAQPATQPALSSDTIAIIRGGITMSIPATLGIIGPGDSPSFKDLTLLGDGRVGTISGPTGVLHESEGGVINVVANLLSKSDYMWLLSADPSLYTLGRVSGTPTAGEMPGLRFTLNYPTAGTTYDFRYTVQAGDTNSVIALGICNAITAAYTADTSGFQAALNNTLDQQGQGMGPPFQTGCANQVAGADMYFDQPWVSGTTASALNSANTTTSLLSAATSSGTPRSDGGPVLQATRWYPVGYTLATSDLGPYLNLQYRLGSGGYAQLGYLNTIYGSAGWTMNLAVSGGVKMTLDTDRLAIDKPLALSLITTTITGPAIAASANALLVIIGGTSGVQFNDHLNGGSIVTINDSGLVRSTGLTIGGPQIPSRFLTVHAGVNQNLTVFSNSGTTAMEAINDAGNAFVPLYIYSSFLTLNGITGGALQNNGASIIGWDAASIYPAADNSFSSGSTIRRWNGVYSMGYFAGAANLAGATCAVGTFNPGTSVVTNGIVTNC